MEDRNQKVVIFDDYVCEKNQGDIINYFIQGFIRIVVEYTYHNHII